MASMQIFVWLGCLTLASATNASIACGNQAQMEAYTACGIPMQGGGMPDAVLVCTADCKSKSDVCTQLNIQQYIDSGNCGGHSPSPSPSPSPSGEYANTIGQTMSESPSPSPSPSGEYANTIGQTMYGDYSNEMGQTGGDYGDYLTCRDDQEYCYASTYDSQGMWNGSKDSCVNRGTRCACSPQWEHECWSGMGSETWDYWCQEKTMACPPPPCNSTDCYMYTYDTDGYMMNMTTKCVTTAAECTCGVGSLQTPCLMGVDYHPYYECMSAKFHQSCPVACGADEMECWATPYDTEGNMDWEMPSTKSCVKHLNYTASCPCNQQWEHTCTSGNWSYCSEKEYPCPTDCGNNPVCWGMQYLANGSFMVDKHGMPKGTQTCGTSQGTSYDCPCNTTHEIKCTMGMDGANWTECLPKVDFGGACPVNCEKNGSVTCHVQNYDSDGTPDWSGDSVVCKGSYDECMGLCGSNSQQCGTGDMSYCLWSGDSMGCPIMCTEAQHECWTDTFDAQGEWNGSTQSCIAQGSDCPCPANSHSCKDEWGSWCVPTGESCPVICNYTTQQHCMSASYFANGTESSFTESCKAKGQSCGCGNNALSCSWKDPMMNETFQYCTPAQWEGVNNSCPVECKESETHCMVDNFNKSGHMLDYKETCVPHGQKCPCGTHTVRCQLGGGSDMPGMSAAAMQYCMPEFDMWTNETAQCPVHCNSTQKMCSVPSFDGNGMWIRSHDYCTSPDTACDCTKGSGSKSCTFEDGYTDCIPASEYCPVTCSAGQVSCPPKTNYKKDGTWLSDTAPSKGEECKAKFSDCACGTGARVCKDPLGLSAWCEAEAYGCPVICKETETICTVVNYDLQGNALSFVDKCIAQNGTCPCGGNNTKCTVEGRTECFPSSVAKHVCPCKASEKTCYVRDFDTSGGQTGMERAVCVPNSKDAVCPCGKNAKSCSNECLPKFAKEVQGCPMPCQPSQERAGNETCKKENLDTNGASTGEDWSCLKPGACTPGRGQKKCPTGATISTAYTCKNIYAIVLNTSSAGSRRLAMVSTGQKQTATITFTLKDLKSNSKGTAAVKVKLDSIVQLQSQLKTKLSMVPSGTEATMRYQITNLGASKVSPSQVAEKLRGFLNSGSPDVKSALATLGTVKLGKSGCCTMLSDIKAVVEKTSPTNPITTTTTTLPSSGTAKEIVGTLALNVTLPSGVTASDFVQNTNVKTGIEKGIATKLSIPSAWVSVVLTVGRRLLTNPQRLLSASSSASINVAFTITVPPQNTDSAKSATSLNTILASVDNDTKKNAWSSTLGTSISQETSGTYSVQVSTLQAQIKTTDDGPKGTTANFATKSSHVSKAAFAAHLVGTLLLARVAA